MKYFIVALAVVMMAQVAMTQNYVTLSAATINNSALIRNLRALGADYVAQQGVFVSTKAPFLGNFYEITQTVRVERAITASVTYYRYTVILADQDDLTEARATYVINYRPSNSNFIVASYSYTIIGGNPNNEPSVGGPSLVDIRTFNDGGSTLNPLSLLLDESFEWVVDDAIAKNRLPNSNYRIQFVYNAYSTGSGYPPQYVFLVKAVNDNGRYYRIQITATEDVQGEPHVNPTYIVYPN